MVGLIMNNSIYYDKSIDKEYVDVYSDIELIIDNGAKVSLILNYHNESSKINVKVFNNSSLNLVCFGNNSRNINESYEIYENSYIDAVCFYNTFNSNIESNISLMENNAAVDIKNIIVLKDKMINKNINIIHLAKHTKSRMNEVGLVSGTGKLFIEGSVKIEEGNSNSDSNQKLKGIILSKDATIKMNPTLYIDNFDVLAGHGAAIGSINEGDLFYLMSRGLSKTTATKLLIKGLVESNLVNIDDLEKQRIMLGVEELL